VEQVYVYNCSFTKTTNGARIKTFKVFKGGSDIVVQLKPSYHMFSDKKSNHWSDECNVIILLQDGPGYARNITYEKITLIQAYNPILINQHYVGLEVYILT